MSGIKNKTILCFVLLCFISCSSGKDKGSFVWVRADLSLGYGTLSNSVAHATVIEPLNENEKRITKNQILKFSIKTLELRNRLGGDINKPVEVLLKVHIDKYGKMKVSNLYLPANAILNNQVIIDGDSNTNPSSKSEE